MYTTNTMSTRRRKHNSQQVMSPSETNLQRAPHGDLDDGMSQLHLDREPGESDLFSRRKREVDE